MTSHDDRAASAGRWAARLGAVLPAGSRWRRVGEWGVVAWAVLGVCVIVWFLFLVLHRLAGMVPFLVVAGLAVFALGPAVRALARLRIPRPVATTLVFLAALVALPAVASLVARTVLDQLRSLLEAAPHIQQGGFVERLTHSSNSVLRRVGDAIQSWVVSHQHDGPRILASLGSGLARAGVVLLLGGFLGYLIMLARPGLSSGIRMAIPQARRATALEVIDEIGRIISGFVRARLIVSAVVGALACLGLWVIGMPSWLVLGLLVGIANLIPTLGSFIGAVPVVLVSLVSKPPQFLLAAVAVMVVAHAVDGYILSPIVMRETMDLHPVVVLLAVVIGAEVFGLWGVFLGVPLAAMIQYAVRRWVGPRVYGPPEDAPIAVSAADLPLGQAEVPP